MTLKGRILVCGGRDYEDSARLRVVLDACVPYFKKDFLVIHGGARGADDLASWWARLNGYPCVVMPAPWHTHRNGAGPVRNQWMIKHLQPDLVIAFPGGSGTANMVAQAIKSGIDVYYAR